MSEDLRARAAEYLALRRVMGYQPCDQEWLIREFLDHLESEHASTISVSRALIWACLPQGATPRWRHRRLAVIRLFAAHVHACDPQAAELIPAGMLPARVERAIPYIYTATQIADLARRARALRPVLRGHTLATIIGLMAATGMRTGEAVALNTTSIDNARSTILVIGKGGTQRLLPVHATTLMALTSYLETSRTTLGPPHDDALFLGPRASRALANSIQIAFRAVAQDSPLPRGSGNRAPRLHDLRHTFAVNTLIDAHRDGVGVQARIAALSTYLGHVSPADTYWYLTASPELLHLVSDRLENYRRQDLP
ncbi:tyrosine-type recombinase/integrase [Rhodococcus sp. H29-C3]|uniref:tyrosine-type recombinase/integrase n=1 Tax=Rhodococcus sp. H29-C3 TaxID=3046307 RepID=UPI0024BAFEC2|nr:tyrosine-type recombinase/integrase [Rhodococcus sp. H29-C3]MDJ0362509.1 tyrosine-type recombinase/integrase [Rhodococcus sp. H29-C3]